MYIFALQLNGCMKNHYEIIDDSVKVYSNGQYKERFFFIDKEDLPLIADHSWRVYVRKDGYTRVETSLNTGGKIIHFSVAMHLLGKWIDHIDNDPTNNRRSNLRPATVMQNSQNAPKHRKKCSSVYKGVCFHKRKKLWMTLICANKKSYFVGYYRTEIEAAIAYNQKAKELHGDFAFLNKIPV